MALRLVQAVRVKSIPLPENDDVEIMAVSPLVLKLLREEHGSLRLTPSMVDMWAGARVGSERSFILVRSEGF